MATTFKFGGGNWAVKDGYALAYNDENNNFKPLPFDFTRASTATRVNKQGLIETVPSGKPRIDFLDNTSGHLLLEPSRTNLMPYSENFSIGNWAALSGSSVQANVAISPDGTQNASRFNYDGTGNGRVEWGFISGLTSGVTYTFSVYLKSESGEVQNVQIGHSGWGLETVTVSSEWKRYTQTVTSNSTTAYPRVKLDTANSILVWGYQMEAGSYQTSYIKTEGSSVTRSAETCNQIPPSSIIGQTEGSAYFEYTCNGSDSSGQRIFVLRGDSYIDRIVIFDQAGKIRIYVSDGGVLQLDATTNVDTVSTHKVAFRYKLNDFKLYIDGTAIVTDATFIVPTLNSVYVGTSEGFGGTLGGNVSDVKLYDTALTDTELQNLTS